MRFFISAFLLAFFLSGCFFTAKEITLDPDKGFNHSTIDQEVNHASKE